MHTFANLGYWRVGGPMERFLCPATPDDLRVALLDARERGRGFFVLGRGSNLLVPDEGLSGTTVQLGGEFCTIREVDGNAETVDLRVGAGVWNDVLLKRQLGKLSGLGALAGVPGTMGGAIAMNAGTALGEIDKVVTRVEGLDAEGRACTIERRDLPMRYREGGLPVGFVVTAAVLRLSRAGADDEAAGPAYLFADVDGLRIRYARRGAATGTAVLFIHGFGGDLDNWLFNIDAVGEKNPVIALDLPGHGQSEVKLPGTSIEALADFVGA